MIIPSSLSVKQIVEGVPSILRPGGPHAPNTFTQSGFVPGDLRSFNITKSDTCTSSKANVKSIVGFYLDFDLKDWRLAEAGFDKSSAEGIKLVADLKNMSDDERDAALNDHLQIVLAAIGEAVGVEPTYITCTGGGFHVGYWYDGIIEKTAASTEAVEAYTKAINTFINEQFVHPSIDSVRVCADPACADISRNERDIGSVKASTSYPTSLIFWNPDGIKLEGPDEAFTGRIKDSAKKRRQEADSAKSRQAKAERQAKAREEKRKLLGAAPPPEVDTDNGQHPAPVDGSKFSGDWTTFDIERLFTRTGREIRLSNGQLDVDCPFMETNHPHFNGNAILTRGVPKTPSTPGKWADFYCQHSSCKQYTHRLGKAIEDGIFSIEDANKVSSPLPRMRKAAKRGGLLPSGSDESVANAFLANMPYAADDCLAYFGEDFYSYNQDNKHWVKLHEVKVVNDIALYFDDAVYSMGVNSQGDEKFGHWLANSRAVRDVADVLARKCKALPASEKFKNPTPGVMFLNGFLHPNGMLTTDESMTKEMGCTAAQAIDYDWDENDALDCSPEKMEAEMPRFCSYIKGSLGVTSMDHPDVKTLLEYPGLCLLGLGATTQKVLVPQGIPGTGKSTYMNIIRSYFDTAAICVIHPQQTSGQFQMTELIGRRINMVDDVSEKTLQDTSRFKTITTGGLSVAEFKGINRREYFNPIAGTILNLNGVLRTAGADPAFIDRLHLISFPHRFRGMPGVKIKLSVEILKHEREALLRFIIRSALLALRNRQGQLAVRESDGATREQLMADSDTVWNFLSDACEVGPDKRTSVGILFNQYLNYCANTNEPINKRVNMKQFSNAAVTFGDNRGIAKFKDRSEDSRFYRAVCVSELGLIRQEGMR